MQYVLYINFTNAPMQKPWSRIICHEPEGNVVGTAACIDRIPAHRGFVIVNATISASYHREGMLGLVRDDGIGDKSATYSV